jgi:hypothetical protein
MPGISKQSTMPQDRGPAGREWQGELDGYVTSFVEVGEDVDLTPLLEGLPGDVCPSPHWGYVFEGRMWWRFGEREEVFVAGDAYYVPPGHTAGADAESSFVVFSPAEVMAEVDAHMMRRAMQLQGA